MESRNLKAVVIIGLSLFIGLAISSPLLADDLLLESETNYFNTSVTSVSEDDDINVTSVGVNADPVLHYGEIPRSSKVTKYIDISSNELTGVEIRVEGNISDKIDYQEYQVFYDNKTLRLPYKSMEEGYFEGEAAIKTYTAKNSLGKRWLNLRKHFLYF